MLRCYSCKRVKLFGELLVVLHNSVMIASRKRFDVTFIES